MKNENLSCQPLKFIFLLILLFSKICFSETAQYLMILNAEEKETNLHLFKYTEDENHFPLIDEIFTEHSSSTLTLFKENPTLSFQSVKPMLDKAVLEYQKLGLTNPVSLRILGTDSMRFLNKKAQLAIFANIKNNIIIKYQKYLKVIDTSILSGKMEALYRWLAVNYVAQHFQNQTPTFGIIDIGKMTTQFAFAIPSSKRPIDEITLTLNGIKYIVFTKNFLGLGLKEMEERMNADEDAKYCYPNDAPFNDKETGNFNFINCSALYQETLKKYNVKAQILPLYSVSHFIVFNDVYPIYQFFGKNAFEDKETFEEDTLEPVCGNTWNALKEAYSTEPEHALLNYCANAVFLSNLFFNTLQLHGSQLSITKTVNNKKIDWAVGAVLASLVNSTNSLEY